MSESEGLEIIRARTEDITDKKCPSCGATLQYDPDTKKLACPYCGFAREIPAEMAADTVQEQDFESAKLRASQDWGTKKKSIVCKQCGGETVYDEAETAASCPFCGSNNIMPVDDDEDIMAPGGVVPFEISQEKASQLFKSWLGGKLFAPNAAKQACVAKDFNGIYLPYWTYDTNTSSIYTVSLGFDYKDGDETKTRWKNYSGGYDEFIDDEVVYASKKTTDPYIRKVSIFDFKKLRPYTPEFIAGFAAERYTVGLDDGWNEAKKTINQKLRNHLSSQLMRQYHADHVRNLNLNTQYSDITFKYLLAPIWLSNFKYNGTLYKFVVNGQTGKIAGRSPISWIKVMIAVLIGIAILILLFGLMN